MDRGALIGRDLRYLPKGNVEQSLGLLSMGLPSPVGDAVGLLADGVGYAKNPSSLTPTAGLLSLAGMVPGIPRNAKGLMAEAKKYDNFDDFRKAFLREIRHGDYWHLTDNPNFAIDAAKGPRDMSSLASGQMRQGKLMMTSDLNSWADYYGGARPYAARLDFSDVPKESYWPVNRGFGNEFFVDDPSAVKVLGVYPVKNAKAMSKRTAAALPQDDAELRALWESARN